jgi:hypothetical protein
VRVTHRSTPGDLGGLAALLLPNANGRVLSDLRRRLIPAIFSIQSASITPRRTDHCRISVRRTKQAQDSFAFQDLGAAAAIGRYAGARIRARDAAAGRSHAARFSSPTAARAVAPATPTVAAADAGALRTIYRGPYSAAPCSRELVNGRSMLP